MARKLHKKNRSASGGEHWTKLIRNTMEEPAWRALSSTAQALYPWIKLEWRGVEYNNNGKLRLSVRQAAARLGVAMNTAAEAFRDLQRKGFIVQTEHACLGVEGEAKSPAYEVTELKMPGAEGSGRKLYKQWKPGSDFPVQKASINNPGGIHGKKSRLNNKDSPVSKTKTNTAGPVSKTDTGRLKNEDENRVFKPPFVSETKTSLSCHTPSQASAPTRQPAPNSGQAARARPTVERKAATKELPTSAATSLSMLGGTDHGEV